MKVLFITNMFPVPDYIYFGIHVKEQIEAIEKVVNLEKEVYFINGREKKWNYFKSIGEIKKLAKSGNFDLIHIHFGLSGVFLLFNPFITIPTVLSIHGSDLNSNKMFGLMRFITKALVKKVSGVIVMNETMAEKLSAYRKKVFVQACGINLRLFEKEVIPKSNDKILIGFPGNQARREKNFSLFQQIIQLLNREIDTEMIAFHNMSRSEVAQNLNKIDLLLMTSTSEGSPQIIKEAMACNKAIISTAVGDVKLLLNGVKNCTVVNTFNPEDFISPILELLNRPSGERSSDGREKLIGIGLDSQSVAESINKFYQSLV
ncbi:MAG TPA: glycosyltransferase family 4 protein [Pedobacter sp.]|nr:glycosyltransferase family 4 protein [Pedobacter sp.]